MNYCGSSGVQDDLITFDVYFFHNSSSLSLKVATTRIVVMLIVHVVYEHIDELHVASYRLYVPRYGSGICT